MAKKLDSIVELAAQKTREISANSGNYMAFLTTAAHNFKYNFRDQLLIYAQKPDATACAQIDFWNKHGRYVNRGTRGIALLVDTDQGYKLRYVFDMSDTNSRQGRVIPIWKMEPRYEDAVIEALENSYGEFPDRSGLAARLLETAKVIVEDNFGDYYTELRGVKEGSLLEELDDLSTETWFRGLVESSVAFIMLTRCGMLLITNDGRKLALDQRLLNPLLPDSDTSKINACVGDVFDIWQRTADQRSAQMVFCDLSTPGKNRPIEMVPNEQGGYEMAEFQNVYDDLRNKLIARGIPAEEIAYIHSANTETQKKELFGKVRSGQVRVLIGSTQKMGAGTNVQKKLVALHHLDCPWRPSDLQQREGRIIRQGNENNEVDIYTYVTENTFDSYLYQLVEGKQKFIGQIMTSKSPVRSCEDIDETALSYAEIKALCTGNPHIKEKMDLDIDVQRLRLLKANHLSQRYALEDQIIKTLPQQIAKYEQSIEGYLSDMDRLKENTHPNEDGFSPMEVEGTVYTDKKAAGSAILAACKAMTSPEPVPLGQYRGFSMDLSFASLTREFKVTLKGALYYTTNLGTDVFGNILRLDNLLESMEERISTCREQLENTRMQLENAKLEVDKPFPQEDELKRKSARLDELNILLNMDKRESEIVDGDVGDEVTAPARGSPDRER